MGDTVKTRFGSRCKAVRVKCGLSQTDMVRHHGFTLSHYQRIERGRDVRIETMARIAEAFGMTLAQLLDGV